MRFELRHNPPGARHGPAPGLRLGRALDEAGAADLDDLAADGHRPVEYVDVTPPESQ